MDNEPESPSSAESELILEDTSCQGCGYNLRGLDIRGRCPECASPISLSLKTDLLRDANPKWLARVKLGADLLYYAIFVGILVGLLAGVIMVVIPSVGMPLIMLFAVGGSVFHVIAIFCLTAQEPRSTLTERDLTWRKLIRVCVVIGAVNETLSSISEFGLSNFTIDLITSVIDCVLGPLVIFAEFAYAHQFALRIPDLKLARSTTRVKWGLSITTFLLAGAALAGMAMATTGALPAAFSTSLGSPTPGTALPTSSPSALAGLLALLLGIGGCVTLAAFLVFGIWSLRLLLKYRRAFRTILQTLRE